jgi:glycosyltransferase involved in cell wall biosynthesis
MKISIITAVFNNHKSIERAIQSVLNQSYSNIEFIIIDAQSTDGTFEIIQKYKERISIVISEPDNGIYDALNKGISHANGEVIAVLHSDDEFHDRNVVSNMMKHIKKTRVEFCFSNVVIVDNLSKKILRYYMSSYFSKWMLRVGWMPPHPACFIKKTLFDEFGLYSTNYKIAGDFDLLVRFFYGRKIEWSYLDLISVKMSSGGVSNSGWRSKWLIFNEINHSLKSNNVWSLPFFQLLRYPIRLMEVLIKPRRSNFD